MRKLMIAVVALTFFGVVANADIVPGPGAPDLSGEALAKMVQQAQHAEEGPAQVEGDRQHVQKSKAKPHRVRAKSACEDDRDLGSWSND